MLSAADDPTHEWHIGAADTGLRLDLLLGRQLMLSRAAVRRLIDAGAVRVEGRRAKPGDKGLLLEAGMCVSVDDTEAAQLNHITPDVDMPLTVLAEGEGYVVVDKPAGVNVHPLRPGERGTLLNRVIARCPQMQGIGEGGLRSGVVHRLDADTSGAVVFATTEARWRMLRQAFAEHRTGKIYRALVRGRLDGSRREVMHLVVGRSRPAKVKVVTHHQATHHHAAKHDSGVRRCDLQWQALRTFQAEAGGGGVATLVRISLGTGFLHQIRVMLAHMGHAVIGDPLYGDPLYDDLGTDPVAAPRHMLHASELHVEDINAVSPDPADFEAVMAALTKGYGDAPR